MRILSKSAFLQSSISTNITLYGTYLILYTYHVYLVDLFSINVSEKPKQNETVAGEIIANFLEKFFFLAAGRADIIRCCNCVCY